MADADAAPVQWSFVVVGAVALMSEYGEPRQHELVLDVEVPEFGPTRLPVCYFEWGDAGAPVLLLVHATGFHARCWDQVVAALAPGYRVIAVDQRGHGRTGNVEPITWPAFGADLAALADALGLAQVTGAGHSMGGHCLVQLAMARPTLFERMLLLDPVIMAPELYGKSRMDQFQTPEEHPVARRRGRFSSWQEMRDGLRGKGSFDLWDPKVLDDYCRYGVLPASDGDGVTLACPGVIEAAVYLGSTSADFHARLGEVHCPVTVLRAPPRDPADTTMDFAKSPTWPELAAAFPDGRDQLLPELTHFIPMQAPVLVAEQIGPPPGSGTATGR